MIQRAKGICGKYTSRWPVFILSLISCFLWISNPVSAQTPSWEAVGRVGAGNPESGANILAAKGGGFFVVFQFQNTTSIGGTSFTAQYGNESIILKMDTSGAIRWWLDIYGQALYEKVVGMAEDDLGNLYIAGNFDTYMEIDSVALNNSAGGTEGSYLARITPLGNLDWVRETVISTNSLVSGMALTASGQLLVGGHFADTARVDSDTLFAVGGSDLFLAAYDTAGQNIWNESFGSPDFDISTAFNGNTHGEMALAGMLRDSAFINGQWYGQNGAEAMVIARLDPAGNFRFVIEEATVTSQDEFFQVAVTETNDILIGGTYSDSVSFGGQMFYSGGSKDILLVNYNPVGSFQWGVAPASSGPDEMQSMVADHLGNAYITGYYTNSLTLGSQTVFSSSIIGDFYLARIDANGTPNWLQNANAGFFDYVGGVGLDVREGKVFVTGDFTSTATFGGTHSVTSAGTSDLYWGYLCQDARVDLEPGQGGSHCIGTTVGVNYQSFGCYNSGNSFRIELSDSGGSFSSPVIIGSTSSMGSGTINCALPYFLTGGNRYRYRVVSNNPSFVSANNGSDIVIYTGSESQIDAGGDSVLCFGESMVLNAGPGFLTYSWSTGASSQIISVTNGGNYSVAVIGQDGCLSRDTFAVYGPYAPPPSPTIQPSGTSVLCTGQSLTLDAGTGYFVYNWNNGEDTRTIDVNAPGVFFLTVENGFGCEGYSDTVTVVANSRPTLSQVGDTLFCSDLTANSYAWYRNGSLIAGANQFRYIPSVNGDHFVLINDLNGCNEVSDTLSILLGVGSPSPAYNFVVYPQPAQDAIWISLENPTRYDMNAELMDLTGRSLRRESFDGQQMIRMNVSGLAVGTYILRLNYPEGQVVQKVNISR